MNHALQLRALSAREFFSRKLHGCSKTDAHRATGIAYSTIHDIATKPVIGPRRDTLEKLQAWSLEVGRAHGVYLSAMLTLGIEALPSTGTEG